MTARPSPDRRLELVAASVLTGVFGAITIYASEWRIGLEGFAPLAQLWTFWALFSASVTFSVQQWVIRSMLDGAALGSITLALLRRLVPLATAVGVVCLLLADVWFSGSASFAALCAALVLGTGANGVGRGAAAAAGATRRLAVLVLGENLIRLALLVPLLAFDASPVWYGLALLAGFGVNLLSARHPHRSGPDTAGDDTSARSGSLATAGLVGLIGYATMFGGPLLLAIGGESDAAVSALFLVVTLARVPFVVTLGLLPRVALHLEQLSLSGESAAVRHFSFRVASAAGVAAVIVGVVALGIADATVGRLFGTRGEFGGVVYALVGGSSMLALSALILTMALLAERRHRLLGLIWSIPVVVAAGALAVGELATVERLSWGLLVVEIVLVLVMVAAVSRGSLRSSGTV